MTPVPPQNPMPQPQVIAPQPMPQPVQNQLARPAAPALSYPIVDLKNLASVTDVNERKNIVGNSIYQVALQRIGETFAGKVTGMMLDESAVTFNRLF